MNEPLRVLHVITRLIVGGAQENTVSSVLGLHRKANLSVRLISGPSGRSEGSLEGEFAGAPGILSIEPDLVRPIHPWKDLRALNRLTKAFRQHRPHLVHTHSGKAGILGRMAARRARVPIVVHTIHGPSFGRFQSAFANGVFRAAERAAGRRTNHFISVADAMSEQYLAAGIGCPNQFTRIFSGFNLDPFLEATNDANLRAKLGLRQDDFVIAKLARLSPLKGHEDLFVVAREILLRRSNCKFLLIGDGPLRQQFERRLAAAGLQGQFVFTGLVQPAEVARYLGIADLLVHLSQREGLARALPQASAAGKPVIAYASDGAPEVCIEGKTGFLIEPGNIQQLTSRLMLLAGDPELRVKLGSAGREWVRQRFAVTDMVEAIYELYLRLAAQAGLLEGLQRALS